MSKVPASRPTAARAPRTAETPATGARPTGRAARSRRLVLLASPLVSGATIMALELVGLRLLAPRFGASTYVWGGLLAVIMAGLAGGYLFGGWLADRRPRPATVFWLLAASAFWVAADLWLAERVLAWSDPLGPTWGPVLATGLLLAVPMVLLGSVSPFVVRLDADLGSLGVTTGSIFALGTAGSLGGTFLAAFWLIPSYGNRSTLRLVIATLALAAVAGLLAHGTGPRRIVAALLLVGAPSLAPAPALGPGIVFRGESTYNTVFVEEGDGYRLLRLNQVAAGFHSIRPSSGLLTGVYYDILYLAPWLSGQRSVLVLGMAGGTTIRGYRQLYPGIRITAVEIDPLVARLAGEYFGVTPGPDLDVHVADARRFLAEDRGVYDTIEVDLFAGGPYAPFYCLTRQFFAAARERLAASGVVAVNVFAPEGDRTLVDAVAATMNAVYPSVFEVPLEEESILLGFRRPVGQEELVARLASPGVPAAVRIVARAAAGRVRPRPGGSAAPVFTDDLAPVERMTHRMIVRRRRAAQG